MVHPADVAEMFMANEPLKQLLGVEFPIKAPVAEMFMANEPLKHLLGNGGAIVKNVAEMFMANEPLKLTTPPMIAPVPILKLQRCLWRMSH